MTPSFRWMFLGVLALANIVVSVPPPLITDACSLICNPGAETEADRMRDPKLYPRFPKASCDLQSADDSDQARVIMRHCLKLCSHDLSIASVANCAAMLSSFAAELGCYCEALSPLSPNTNRLGEQWRLNVLVEYLSQDVFTTILGSTLDTIIFCEIHEELFASGENLTPGRIIQACKELENKTKQNEPHADPLTLEKPLVQETEKQDSVLKSDLDTIKDQSRQIGLNMEMLVTSQKPGIRLKPGEEVTELKRDIKTGMTYQLLCSVQDAVESHTSAEKELIQRAATDQRYKELGKSVPGDLTKITRLPDGTIDTTPLTN